MQKNNLIVSDTSPILNLSLIDELQLLENQFESINIPNQVWEEIEDGEKGKEALNDLRDKGFLEVIEVAEDNLYSELSQYLDRGESAAIKYAINQNADLILLDEKEGRKAARRHNLEVTGVIGILLKASNNQNISLKESLDKLREEGFWISESLYERILDHEN